ncbi:MAG: hypothetical protein KatS3mg105_2701 [Gemmatales bacterium]|nr:MAG: hypothetical protein KatS3mg105_2701 [Gemmatales bacterium]
MGKPVVAVTGACLFSTCFVCCLAAADDLTERTLPRCEVIPRAGQQVSFLVDGVEKVRWHFGSQYPRPFFYPLRGPSGAHLTRMGHPGAPNHDHHRSIWFAHHSVNGIDFWSDRTKSRIRQKGWYAYRDGQHEAVMASALGWYDADGNEIMQQELVAALLPLADAEHALEIQITLKPVADNAKVELGKTNFGFLAVRVAKSLSVHFGGGRLTNSEGEKGEANIFGKKARWMDYSGTVAVGSGKTRKAIVEGITYFDHPHNPRYPTRWHVREDGWMGASFCLDRGDTITAEKPLVLRYLLHAHSGAYDHAKAESIHKAFAARPGFIVLKSTKKHQQFEVNRRKR